MATLSGWHEDVHSGNGEELLINISSRNIYTSSNGLEAYQELG